MESKLLINKVKFFKKTILELIEFSNLDKIKFMENDKNIAAVKSYLYSAIQTMLFLCTATIEFFNLGKPTNYYEIFDILCKNGKLANENKLKYIRFIEIRNDLLFKYDVIDSEYVYNILTNDVNNLNVFLKDLKKKG